jgi:hypothetical protein
MFGSRGLLNYVSSAAHLFEPVGNLVGVDRQSVFIRMIVIVGPGRKIHDYHIFAADVLVCVPDTSRNVDELPAIFRKDDLGNQTAGGRVASVIKEHEQELARENAVAIVMQLMQAPTFNHSRTERKSVGEDEWIDMPLPARVEHFANRPALIDVSGEVARSDARRQGANPATFRCDRGLVSSA